MLLSLVLMMVGCNQKENIPRKEALIEITPLGSEAPIQFTAFEGNNSDLIEDGNITLTLLPFDKLGSFGASFIYLLFGESINGMYMELNFFLYEHGYMGDWIGRVAPSEQDLKEGRFLYQFRLVANAGRLLDLKREYELSLLPGDLVINEEVVNNYKLIVRDYLQRLGWNNEIEWKESENLPADQLLFLLTGEWGPIELVLQRETARLVSIETLW